MYLATNFSISRVVDSAEILMRLICINDVNILYFIEECFDMFKGIVHEKEVVDSAKILRRLFFLIKDPNQFQ